MFASVRTVAFLLLASVIACCGSDGADPSDAGPDGGDAGNRDAGVDASSLDAGIDAGPPVDAGPPDWIAVAGLAEECPVHIARNPAGVVPPLRFEDCPQFADGCRQVRVDWKDEVEGPYFQFFSGDHDGTHGYFSYWRGNEADASNWVIARDDGAVVAVLRVPVAVVGNLCIPTPIEVAEGRFAFALIRFADSDSILDTSVLVGRLDDPAGSLRLLATLDGDIGPNSAPQDLTLSATHVALEVIPGNDVFLLDDTGTIVSSTVGLSGQSSLGASVDDRVFLNHLASPREILRASAGGLEPFLPTDGVSVIHMATDGEHMAWLKLIGWDGTLAERSEVWASPFASDPSDLAPVLLGGGIMNPPHVGFGKVMAGAPRPGGGADVAIYTVDGTRLGVATPPSGTEYRGRWAVYVGPEEVAVAPRSPGPLNAFSIQLVEYSALDE